MLFQLPKSWQKILHNYLKILKIQVMSLNNNSIDISNQMPLKIKYGSLDVTRLKIIKNISLKETLAT